MRYVPIAGTHGWRDGWCMSDDSPFALMMAAEGFTKITLEGRPFRWSTALDGLLGVDQDWIAAADALAYFLDRVPVSDRNVIAHSHGGNVALIAAASGLQLRTLTTVGTPHRHDVDYLRAAQNVLFWQHIYDRKRDWIALLGQVGDHQLDYERRFLVPGNMVNYGLSGISHSKVLRDEKFLHYWKVNGWLSNIVGAGSLEGIV